MIKTYYHTLVLYKLKQNCKSDIVDISRIREVIGRVSIRKGGIPKQFVFLIIEDLLNLELIKRLSNEKYRILSSPLESRIKALMMAC